MEHRDVTLENRRLSSQVEELSQRLTSLAAREEQWYRLCMLESRRCSALCRILQRRLPPEGCPAAPFRQQG